MSTRRRRGQCSRRVEIDGCGDGAWFVVELVRDGKLVEDDARCRFMHLDASLSLDAEAGPYQQETSLVVASSHVADKLLLEVPVGPNALSFSFRDPVGEDVLPPVSDEKSESDGNAKDDATREQDGHACGVMLCSLPQPSCSGDAHLIRVPYEFRFPDSVEYRIFKSALESILVQHKLVPRQVAVAQRLIALLKPPRAPPPKKHTTTTATIDIDATTNINNTVNITKGPAMLNGISSSCSSSNQRRKKVVVCAKAASTSNGVCGKGNRKNSPKGRRLACEDWSGADKEDEGVHVDASCDEDEETAVERQRPCACCMMMHPPNTLSPHPTVPRSGWDGRLEVCPSCKANLFKARQKAQAKQELYDPCDHHETLCAVCSRHWRRGNLTLYMCDSCSFSFCKACLAKVVSEHEYTALQKDDGSSWCCPGCRYSVPRLPHDAGTDDSRLQAGTHALSWLHRWGSAPLGAPPEPPPLKHGHGGRSIHSPVPFAPPLRLQGLSSGFSPVPDSPSPCASTSVFSSFIKEEEADNPYKRPRPITTLTHTRSGRKLRATGAEDDDCRGPTSPHLLSSPSSPPPPHLNGHTHSHTHTDVSSVSSLCATVSEGANGRLRRGGMSTLTAHTHTHARAQKHGVCGNGGDDGDDDDSEIEEDEPPLPPLDPKAFVPPRAAIWSVPVPPSASLTVQDLFLPITRQLPPMTPTGSLSGRGKKQGPGRGGGRGRGGRGKGGRWANHIPKHKLATTPRSSTATTSNGDGGLAGAKGAAHDEKADSSTLTLTHALISSLSPTSSTAREARTRQSTALESFLHGEEGEEGEKGLGVSGKAPADAHDTHVCALNTRPRTPRHTHADAHTPRSGASGESGSGKKQRVQAQVEPPELPPVDDTKDHLDFFAAYVSYLKELPVPNRYTENTCFLCKDGGELLECDCDLKDKVAHCKKVYHEYCLGYEVSTDPNVRWLCPRHVCMTCADKKATVYFCRYCPNSACRDHLPQFSHIIRGHPRPRELSNSQYSEMVCAECVRLVIRARFREEVPRGFCAVVDEIEDTYMTTQLGEGLAFHPMIINRDRETRRRRQQELESGVKDMSIEEEGGLLPSSALMQTSAAVASSSLRSSSSSAAAAAAILSNSSSSKSTPKRDVSITANGLPN